MTTTQEAKIGVNDENAPPEFVYVGQQNVTEGSLLEFSVTANDIDGDQLDYTYTSSFIGPSVSSNSNGLTFSWTPDNDDSGNYSVSFKVSDGGYSDTMVVPIRVFNDNRPPEFDELESEYVVNESERLVIVLGASDPDGDQLSRSVVNSSNASGTLTGDLYTLNTGYSDSGTYDIEFSVTDGIDTTYATTTVIVKDKNAPPVLASIGSKSVQAP
ncbi:MAG: Ig-like domain-containing protein, partial [Methanolobus sp.]